MMLRLAGVAVVLAALAAPAHAAPPPTDLRVERTVVPLPPEVTYTRGCAWTVDGDALLCESEFQGVDGRHVAVVGADGSDFRCLTCAQGMPEGRRTHKLFTFPDGRRFVLGALPPATQNADEGASIKMYVGECAPSIADCDRLDIAPIALPPATGSLNDREVRLSPDGRKLVWTIVRADGFLMLMGDLVRSPDGYEARDVRVLNPAPAPVTAADHARRAAFSEAKSFRDPRTLVYGSTESQGSNLDVHRLDLATGAVTRVTANGEWDEDSSYHPAGRYLTVGSTRRNYNTLRGMTVVPLPPFLDSVKTVFFARFKLANLEERRRALEPWLTDEQTERDGGVGQQLSDQRGGWDARMPVTWRPDGRAIVWTDHGPGGEARIVIARLPELEPVERRCGDADPECLTPTPEWAPLLRDYPPLPPGTRTIPGPRGGAAVVTQGGIVIGGAMRIEYHDYTTADGLVLNGTETAEGVAFGDQRLDYRAEVTASGPSAGVYRAQAFGEGRHACGTFEGRLGDRREITYFGRTDPMCGFPPPPACGNRRDDDGDGLEDGADRGCVDDEDPDEAGPPARRSCTPRAIPGTGARPLRDGAAAVDVPGAHPVDVAATRWTRAGRTTAARFVRRMTPVAWSPPGLRDGVYTVRFRSGRVAETDVLLRRNGRFLRAGAIDRSACGMLARARLTAPIASRGGVVLRITPRRRSRVTVKASGLRPIALGVLRPGRTVSRRLGRFRGGSVKVVARRGRASDAITLRASRP